MRAITFLLYIIVMCSSPSYASTTQSGYITNIIVNAQGVFFFNHDGVRTSVPTCASNYPTRWVFNSATPAGQSEAAHILTAYSLHRKLEIYGVDNCNYWADTESVEHVAIDD